jgi:hypothetical protein
MSTEPNQCASSEVGLEAMAHLREANLHIAAAYRHAADEIGENSRRPRRDNPHTVAIAQAWNEAEVEFRHACTAVAATIDTSLRLADIESLGEHVSEFSSLGDNDPASVTEIATFDQHIHELFEELQRQWPELEQQPPLAKFDEDDRALSPPWRLELQQRPFWFIYGLAIIILVVGGILWMVVTQVL